MYGIFHGVKAKEPAEVAETFQEIAQIFASLVKTGEHLDIVVDETGEVLATAKDKKVVFTANSVADHM